MTPALTAVVVGVLVLLVVVLLVSLVARRRENAGLRPYQVAPERPATGMAEVDRLVRAGRKIQAIKVYRELTGVGLKEAKDAVERWNHPTAPAPPPLPGADMSTVDDALRAGRTIEAIKLYREATGVGLKQAKDAVERRAAGLPPAPAPATGADLSEVDRLLAEGRPIQAIKVYRELTGVGLKQARDAVEARRRFR
jgi:ribosomal protein L7/L12